MAGTSTRVTELEEYAETLFETYWRSFGNGPHMPRRLEAADGFARERDEKCWIPCLIDDCSSTNGLVSMLSERQPDIYDFLHEQNCIAANAQTAKSVLFIGTGWDGLSTNVDSRLDLRNQFRATEIALMLVLPNSPDVVGLLGENIPGEGQMVPRYWAPISVVRLLVIQDLDHGGADMTSCRSTPRTIPGRESDD